MNYQCYGYLFGKVKLYYDPHHDEVFTEKFEIVVMFNNCWLYDYQELVAIAKEILGDNF